MSWFLNIVGTPAAVKAAIQKDTCLSGPLKAALSEICDDAPWTGDTKTGLRIAGSGHCGQGSSITALVVERVALAVEPPAQDADPQSPPNPPDGT